MTQKIRLISGFFTVGIWTFASRILGFVRDILIAAFLGSGPIAEAFLIAFSLPNMFRRLFAEGAFNTAFVPMFAKRVEDGSNAKEFAEDAFSGLAAVLIIFTILAQIFMPWLVWMMASGYVGDARFTMATDFGRVAFPYIVFISLAALLSGVLNSLGRFAAAAAAPLLLNIILILSMIGASYAGWPIGWALAWAAPIAGIAQLALVWIAAARAGMRILPRRPRMTPALKRLAIIAAPAALAGGVVQINLLVGRQIASQFEGAVAWLNYADRLYQLPLGVVGIAIGVVLLPDLSQRLRADDISGSRDSLNRAAEFTLLLTLPAAAALITIALPLISVMYERGTFVALDSSATANAVIIYGIGLPAFVLAKVLSPIYFARENTRTPFNFAVISMIVNAVVAVGLMPIVGYLAAAIGTSFAAWVMVVMLWRGARQYGDAVTIDARLKRQIPLIVLASALMGALVWSMSWLMADGLSTPGWRYLALLSIVIAGMVSYGLLVLTLKITTLKEMRQYLRR